MTDIEQNLKTFVEDKDDVTFEEAKELYQEQLDDIKDRAGDGVDDANLESMAFTQFRGEFNKQNSVPSQDAEEVEIMAIGHDGIQQWSQNDVLLGYGIANPDNGPANKAVFIIEEGDVNLEEAKDKFYPYNSLKGNFSVSEASNVTEAYVCNSTSNSEIVNEPMEMSESERQEWINENHITDRATLKDITDSMSKSNDQGFADDFGTDIKRMQATIVSWYIPGDWSFGVMTLQDESVVNPAEELEAEVIGEEDNRQPGLTAWCDPESMEYGEFSVCDFYGTVTRGNDGQVMFNVFGMYPVLPNEIDLSRVGGNDDSGSNDGAEETSI